MLENDAGEQVLSGIEAATGTRPPGCPWRQLSDPFVASCVRALRPYRAGQPVTNAALRAGVEVLDGALNAIEVHDLRAERAERDRARDKNPPPSGPRPPKATRRKR